MGIEVYFTILVSIYWILIFQWWFKKKTDKNIIDLNNAKVSILLAVRNEEANLLRCLNALNSLNFNHNNLEILIGNDDSSDNSESIINSFIHDKPQFKLLNISRSTSVAKGKANVLAQLAQIANGDYFFITDADIEVQPDWISAMLAHVGENTGIVTGYTEVEGNFLLAKLQNLDWTFAQALMKIFFDSNKPLTAMGNNMLVTKEAYLATGGYETIPFSITEDYALFKKVQYLDFECVQVVNNHVKVKTLALNKFSEVINQRKRWLLGIINSLPWYLASLLFIQIMYIPMLCYLAFTNPGYLIYAFWVKLIIQSLFFTIISKSIKSKISIISFLLFDFYSFYLSISTVISLIIFSTVVWKGREYDGRQL